MNRRRLMGMTLALALATFAGLKAASTDTTGVAKKVCACCGASCSCPACTCDVKAQAKLVEACDCCGEATCCSIAKHNN